MIVSPYDVDRDTKNYNVSSNREKKSFSEIHAGWSNSPENIL